MLRKTTLREIRNSIGRYIAILAIVALGVGFFAGLKVTREAMVSTTNDYLSAHKFYDYQLISTIGFDDDSVSDVTASSGVKAAEGSISSDVLVTTESNVESVFKAYSITSKVNTLKLSDGRMPKAANECVLDARHQNDNEIGDYITISDTNDSDTSGMFKYKKYKIVGLVESPLYLNYQRGSTSLGTGSIDSFFYIEKQGFDVDYYTSIYVRLNKGGEIFSSEYKKAVSDAKPEMKTLAKDTTATRYKAVVADAKKELAKQKKKYNNSYQTYLSEKESAYARLDAASARITSGEATIRSTQKTLTTKKTSLESSKTKINSGLTQIATSRQQLEAQKPYMSDEQYAEAKGKLDAQETALKKQLAQVNGGLAQIAAAQKKLAASKATLAESKVKLNASRATADKKFADAKTKLDKGKKALDKADNKIAKIKSGKSYALTRSSNAGYVSFDSDSSIVDSIAKVFPIFFFLVAALVCMTTMTRMVEEQRSQIGVLKALGYSNSKVMGKYLFYSGSAAFIGAVAGFFIGCRVFPLVIWKAYGMMYNFNYDINYVLNWKLAAFSLAAALLCSMGATWISCAEDFAVAPAQLIRPKAPKSGKRILLERIKPIWSRISFLYKVSLRNIFRYKKRFFMMVVGISGCTALLIAGFGINDSIKNIANFQYQEIDKYDYAVAFDRNMNADNRQDFIKYTEEGTAKVLFAHSSSVDLLKGDTDKSVSLIASDGKNFGTFISLHKGSTAIAFPKTGEVVICKKLSEQLKIKVGDTITLRTGDYDRMKVKVSGVCDNYVNNFIYVSTATYEKGFGKAPKINTAYGIAKGAVHKAAATCANYKYTAATVVNSDMRKLVDKMMQSLNAVIILVVSCAAALAFIVIFNLTNINITERIREIATIKVLGFNYKETNAYVLRENMFMTLISAVVGIPLGWLLLKFVLSEIKVELVYFALRITPMSYLLSVLLTFVFAILVSIPMSFKLRKVSMTESLKSVE